MHSNKIQRRNILIISPSFDLLGGVANHFKGLHPYWKNKVDYAWQGRRKGIPAWAMLLPDYLTFLFKLCFTKTNVVVVNTSLYKFLLCRTAVYALLARAFGKRVVTFIHGWDERMADSIVRHPWWFKHIYGRSAFIYVLYSGFRDKLLSADLKCPVLLTTTKVADEMLEDFDINCRTGKIGTLLFVARLEESKGIMIALKAFALLKAKHPQLKLSICGSGSAESRAKDYVSTNGIADVTFHGMLSGKALRQEFREADLYILPTHGEGMATSVLEAMAFGLPIVSRPMGGICDFFVQKQMGLLTESLSPQTYADYVDSLMSDPAKVRSICQYNHDYAVEHFMASKVTARFEADLKQYCTR